MTERVIGIVDFIVKQFAEKPGEVSITSKEKENEVTVVVSASPEDMGRIIGKQGRIAKSIRTIVKSVTGKEDKKYFVEIRDRQ